MAGRSRRWVTLALAALVSLASLLAGPSETSAQPGARPRTAWTHASLPTCDRLRPIEACGSRRAGSSEMADLTIRLKPGQRVQVDGILVTPSGAVDQPRLVFQTSNGDRIVRTADGGDDLLFRELTLPDHVTPETGYAFPVIVDVPPGFRGKLVSGRIYLADRRSVLGPPLNLRIEVILPTPAELAATPRAVPTNKIDIRRDLLSIRDDDTLPGGDVFEVDDGGTFVIAAPARFTVTRTGDAYAVRTGANRLVKTCYRPAFVRREGRRHFTCDRVHFSLPALAITASTNLTWTNLDTRPHQLRGVLCDPTDPFPTLGRPPPRSLPAPVGADGSPMRCAADAELLGAAPGQRCEAAGSTRFFTPPGTTDTRLLCFTSAVLPPQDHFSLRFDQPNRTQALWYLVEDALSGNPELFGYVVMAARQS